MTVIEWLGSIVHSRREEQFAARVIAMDSIESSGS